MARAEAAREVGGVEAAVMERAVAEKAPAGWVGQAVMGAVGLAKAGCKRAM